MATPVARRLLARESHWSYLVTLVIVIVSSFLFLGTFWYSEERRMLPGASASSKAQKSGLHIV
jgi:hypothetical protein